MAYLIECLGNSVSRQEEPAHTVFGIMFGKRFNQMVKDNQMKGLVVTVPLG